MQHIATIHDYRTDLDALPLEVKLDAPLMQQDARCDEIRVHVRRGMSPVDLTDMSVRGSFIRCSTDTVLPLDGSASGSIASITLPEACYTVPGPFQLTVQLIAGTVRHTLLTMHGSIVRTDAALICDPEEPVTTLVSLLEEMDELRKLTDVAASVTQEARSVVNRAAPCIAVTAISDPPGQDGIFDGSITRIPDAITGRALLGLRVFGKSTLSGTPSIAAPAVLQHAGSTGSITVTIGDQSVVIITPQGLPGVPVAYDGSFTDASGQDWICDEIDLARGVYIQRCGVRVFDGTSGTPNYYNGHCRIMTTGQTTQSIGLCDRLPYMGLAYASGGLSNNGICFSVPGSVVGCSSTAEWAAWLAANPLTVVYVRELPIETRLPDDVVAAYQALLMDSPIANDAATNMEVTYAADTKAYVDRAVNAPDAYELVDYVTLEADGLLDRAATEDGTPYRFKSVLIKVKTKGASVAGGHVLALTADGVMLGQANYSAKAANTATLYHIQETFPRNGYWFTHWGDWNSNPSAVSFSEQSAYAEYPTYAVSAYPCIQRLTSQMSFPAGTIFEVWAVWA